MKTNTKKKQGFACLTKEQRIAIASRGGRVKCPKGFAMMDSEKQRSIAVKGGKTSRGGGRTAKK